MKIKEFRGKHRFLSNFYEASFVIDDVEYKTVEHWFQAQKTLDVEEKRQVTNASTPGEAKKLGRRVNLRDDWEEVKLAIMETGIRAKFEQNLELKKLLIETGEQELQEGNKWRDTYWGVDLKTNRGKNHLGKILMKLRKELKI